MKILHITRQFHPSTAGVERFTMDLCQHLIQNGIQSDVVTLNRIFYMEGYLPEFDNIGNIKITRIPYWGKQRFFFAPRVLKFVSDYDLLHIHNIDFFSDFLISTKPYHKKPVVVSTHGGFFHTNRLAFVKKIYFHTLTRFLLKFADSVIADSDHDQEIFSPIVSDIKIIENGVDFGRLRMVQKEIEPGLLLYVGRLASNKRLEDLIQCLKVVRARVPYAQLVLVGPDFEDLSTYLRSEAEAHGVSEAVTFAGQVSDDELSDWLGKAHIFVSASAYEAFGISVLEAMSTGTVPVVNELPSFRNFIVQGINGFLTNFKQPELAAETIINLLQSDFDNYKVMGEKAKESAERYAWHNTVDKFIAEYRNVIGREQSN